MYEEGGSMPPAKGPQLPKEDGSVAEEAVLILQGRSVVL